MYVQICYLSDITNKDFIMSDDDYKKIGRRIEDLDNLPEELRSQLQITKTDELEDKILSVLNELYAGMANIDEILVGVYRKFTEIQKRQYLSNKLYRMAQSGLIYSVKGKKGAYCTKKELVEYYSSK